MTARIMSKQYSTDARCNDKINTKLSVLSEIYRDFTETNNKLQPREDFFGARDFYSVVKHFLTVVNKRNSVNQQNEDEELIMLLLRSFGGLNYQKDHGQSKLAVLFTIIQKHMGLQDDIIIYDALDKFTPSQLIQINLNDTRSTHDYDDSLAVDNFIISRHVMAITQQLNSWTCLLDLNIVTYDNIFIFGSRFERDTSNNMYIYLNRIKNCMETGKTLILCDLDEIHESLYDMLNQRYTFIKNTGKMYCRIALGSNSQTCFVDPQFKCVVISTKKDAR
eukprot:33174_1